jgi:hypothetical protein
MTYARNVVTSLLEVLRTMDYDNFPVKGEICCPSLCPVSLFIQNYMKANGYEDVEVSVGANEFTMWFGGKKWPIYIHAVDTPLPPETTHFIRRFDKGDYPELVLCNG